MHLRIIPLVAMLASGVVVTGVTQPLTATAGTPVPLPQRQVRAPAQPAQTWHAVRIGPHVLYGKIASIRGTALTLLLRSGRSVAVDAAAAIAHGDYSAPLFIGKVVSVDGDQVGPTFRAAHVFRLRNLVSLPPDK